MRLELVSTSLLEAELARRSPDLATLADLWARRLEREPEAAAQAVRLAKVAYRQGDVWRSLDGRQLTWVRRSEEGCLWGLIGEGIARGGGPAELCAEQSGAFLREQGWRTA